MSLAPNPYVAWDCHVHLQDYDAMVRRHDLARLVRKMHAVFDGNVRWGAVPWYERVERGQNSLRFLGWWEDPTRAHTIDPPSSGHRWFSSFRTMRATYRHDDAFLLALLRDAQERRDHAARERRARRMEEELEEDEEDEEHQGYFEGFFEENTNLSGTNVDVAWRSLCWFFYEDTNPHRLRYDT